MLDRAEVGNQGDNTDRLWKKIEKILNRSPDNAKPSKKQRTDKHKLKGIDMPSASQDGSSSTKKRNFIDYDDSYEPLILGLSAENSWTEKVGKSTLSPPGRRNSIRTRG